MAYQGGPPPIAASTGEVNVRYGSLADITARSRHDCFTPKSGHSSVIEDVCFVPIADISGAVVDQLAYPTPILRLALWRDQRSVYFAHKRERFGIAMVDQRE
jgi:hypothetical protein